jgi:hypothetical protein
MTSFGRFATIFWFTRQFYLHRRSFRGGCAFGLWWEDALKVGEDVEHCEGYELAATPKYLSDEREGVIRVGEGDREQQEDDNPVVTGIEAIHHRRARWEVGIAGGKERAGELDRPLHLDITHIRREVSKDRICQEKQQLQNLIF